jgi:lipooligosaccharide transport system ATP-binding protein
MVSSEVLIKAHNLTKKFGNLTAVDHIDFEVFKGECVGFLGPNGAGKTTTVRMIYCFLPLTEGELSVAGLSVTEQSREIKSMVGVAPQEDNLDPDFTVTKNLLVYARYFDIPKSEAAKRATEQLKFFQLEEKKSVLISELSTGMKRRLILARALINEPQILLLDEPTTGLDPQARHLVWEEVRALRKHGVTIIITTHYMDEAAALCDRILIMDNGKIIEQGQPAELIKKHIGEDVLEVDNEEKLVQTLKTEFPEARFETFGDRVHVFTTQPHGVFERFVEKYPFKSVTIRNANLEDVFLKLTGRKLRDDKINRGPIRV